MPVRLCLFAFAAPLIISASFARSEEPVADISPRASVEVVLGRTLVAPRFEASPEERRVTASDIVHVPGVTWMRIGLKGTVLGGDPGADGATVRLTSMTDGAVQELNGESLAWTDGWSVFLNGDAVLIEIVASGSQPGSTLKIDRVLVSEPTFSDRSICGTTDDRTLSSDARQGRLSMGCTGWLINDINGGFLTAGHCAGSGTSLVEFNVPLSTTSGGLVSSAPQDQYSFDPVSIQRQNGGVGLDWEYFGTLPNTTTGWTAIQVQNTRYTLASAPSSAGVPIRITGYGTVSSPVSPTWNQVQKTHVGTSLTLSGTAVRYNTDTTGGNSGSPIYNESTGQAIGIHTHGGCTSTGGNNNGTARQQANLAAALSAPLGITASGSGTPSGTLYVIGDLANNFGTLNPVGGKFSKISTVGRRHQGLAYDQFQDMFYMINTLRELYLVNPSTGAATLKGTVSGTTLTFTGLAFDPYAQILYGCTGSNGQLWRINPATLVATALGSATTNQLSGLEYDAIGRRLLAIADNTGGPVLVNINPTGPQGVIGALGANIIDCNGLAIHPLTGDIYTIDATTDNLLRINRTTGAATVIGSTFGAFGANYGMSIRVGATLCSADFNADGSVDGDDVIVFFGAWDLGQLAADMNRDGSTDGDDVIEFFSDWDSGC